MARVCVCDDRLTVTPSGELCVIPGSLGLRQVLIYSTPGVHQFRKADYPWLARVYVKVQGAGGGSGGANAAAGELIARPGGAGGGYSEALIEVASLGATESVVVGAGGAAGGGNNPGGNGGTSSFGGFAVAFGGDGGTANMTTGTAFSTSTGIPGPLVGTGNGNSGGGGAGGGAIRLSATQGMSGVGGESRLGHGGFQRGGEGPGSAPRGRGGGAGGALSTGTSVPGAEGGHGLVIVELHG
ncbi:hypothetical protein [Sphaerimonospora mesophila]|uniref:glycine-rich domain-containing protein n=1 Tax=Sphaerimonospora mesophila TaxID=37483 RepID=UPI0006E3CD5A